MRTIPFVFNGRTCHLLLNGAALFSIYDRYGSDGSVFDPIQDNGPEAFSAICWYLETLAAQGELFRRRQGYDGQTIPTADDFAVGLSPLDVTQARAALVEAIRSGFSREEAEGRKATDVGLLELEKKTERG